MESWFGIATLWFGLALLATFLATRLRVSIALMEIGVGVAAAFVVGRIWGPDAIGADVPWLRFAAGAGAVLLTFLAGTELDPAVMRRKWREVTVVGIVGSSHRSSAARQPRGGCSAWVPSELVAGLPLQTPCGR